MVSLVTAGLMVLSVLGTGSVLAGKPKLVVTGNAAPGTTTDIGQTALPTAVSTSDTVQFTTSIKNAGTSNVSQLYFTTATLPAGATVTNITSDRSGCSITATPLCTFSALRPGDSVSVTVIFTTPAVADSSVTSCTLGSSGFNGSLTTLSGSAPYFCVDLRWYANGFPTSDGGTSHGDFFDWFDGVALAVTRSTSTAASST